MSVYKRGDTYWYEFEFNGSRIRESAKTTSKTLAREAERVRRRKLEEAVNGIVKRERRHCSRLRRMDGSNRRRDSRRLAQPTIASTLASSRSISAAGSCLTLRLMILRRFSASATWRVSLAVRSIAKSRR